MTVNSIISSLSNETLVFADALDDAAAFQSKMSQML